MLPVVDLSCTAPLDHAVVETIVTTTIMVWTFKDVVHESGAEREKEGETQDPIK
jgi:hypothetical protein